MSSAARAAFDSTPHTAPNRGAAFAWVSLVAFGALLWLLVPWTQVFGWAAQEQRAFQNAMAASLRAIRSGDIGAIVALCSATAAYGFVHALGPGHGKVLLGGAALASRVTLKHMAVLTVASSMMQAVTAILLVACAAVFLGWATGDLIGLTEDWLAPLSALAIAGIGGLLALRGLRAWHRSAPGQNALIPQDCGCHHAHGPTVSEVSSLRSPQDALLLIASIAIRPCTGALFVLIIAWRMDIYPVGCLAVLAMGLGTAALNLFIAGSGVTARRLSTLPLEGRALRRFSAGTHMLGGTVIIVMSAGQFAALTAPIFGQ